MKTLSATFIALALATASVQGQMTSMAGSVQGLRVLETNLPGFPQELISLGVREGFVRVAFSVDETGRIEDTLAVSYTHDEMARVAVSAMRRWKFEPAKFNGRPIGAASEVVLKFEVEGTVVVSMTATELLSARIYSMLDHRDVYRPRQLSELDRIPTPITTSSPQLPMSFAKAGKPGQVTVSFYIDESGKVRMPSVDGNEDPELGAVAIDALRTWKFEPPTCKGRPVLVRASQRFNFPAPKA